MMRSIRQFLIFYLLLGITIIAFFTTATNYLLELSNINQNFDIRLQQTTHLLNTVLERYYHSHHPFKTTQASIGQTSQEKLRFGNSLQYQIWDQSDNLILHSFVDENVHLPQKTIGFKNIKINGKKWRTYTTYNPKLNITVSLAEPYKTRNALEKHLTWDELFILLCSYPLFALLIWLIIDRGLVSLKRITNTLIKRNETDFTPISLPNIPTEVLPVTNALNKLFQRLQYTFERNKRFAANAAHELRTPLAALKTQTQIALLSATSNERKHILENIILGVDRASHVVQQLLTLSKLGQHEALPSDNITTIDLSALSSEVIAHLTPFALKKNIDIELKPTKNAHTRGNELILSLLIRNLVDNAIRYTPPNGKVTIAISKTKESAIFTITDNGPGIPENLHERVFERFYRVVDNKESGSGLGLAIVQQIAQLHGAHIALKNPKKGPGLIVTVTFPRCR